MNDRHPSGSSTPQPSAPDAEYAHYAAYEAHSAQHGGHGYDAYSTGGFDTGALDTGTFAVDPLFGDMPGGEYDTGQWATSTGPQPTIGYDPYAAQHHTAPYDTGSFDTTSAWATDGHQHLGDAQHLANIPSQPTHDGTGQWDTTAWNQAPQTGQWETQAFDSGAYDATAWNSAGDAHHPHPEHPEHSEHPSDLAHPADLTGHAGHAGHAGHSDHADHADHADDVDLADEQPYELTDPYEISADASYEADALHDTAEHEPVTVSPSPAPRASRAKNGGSGQGRSRARRRTPTKRSALFTVAVPSACVMGVAGVAAASVGDFGGDDKKETTASAADEAAPVKPSTANNKLDTQLANLSADAGDFADRASRTQERIDLKAERVAAKKQAAAEAARKERLRPKFSLPVKQHGLSAYYGQAGVNWMSAHSGIDFPVSYGTEVLAATDGTVSTKWNSAYGNMAIVTAKDGTETWYCHLSTHKISSGPVKAGDVIAFSGNSGNSTGPHLHFEVRPGGGSAIDPLPWLRSHDLDPT
ncbi:M23 family metallopeptidase [Streptomyces alfalfae]|uniref:M23 family metallopeptidase n=1 Tax=Streptomyces alfalfae TaxID=1642299 RepID=A0A7T4PJ11_9ACTN|nr:M23 family metallopeptidase [Streptomyces alfalfae]QQC90954.1 M23 family metallopeptidase [Streptomyces alfalfae]